MRRAFTLAELLVVLVLSLIFLDFAFSFFANFLREQRLLEAKERLAVEAYRLGEIIARGFKEDDSTYVGGVAMLKNLVDDSSFKIYDDEKVVDINDSDGFTKINGYVYKGVYTNDSFHLKAVKNSLYYFEMNVTAKNVELDSPLGDANYLPYAKLVYTK